MGRYLAYVEYKDSGIEWLGKVPAHWVVSRLGYLAIIKGRLGWKGLTASEYVDDGYIFLATPNIKGEGEIDFVNVNYITAERYFESPELMLQEGDVLVVKDGSTLGISNVVCTLPKPATVNSSIAVIRTSDKLHSNFLFRWIGGAYLQSVIQMMKDGQGVPHLFQADIKKFYIFLPPLEEQRSIARFLDYKTAQIDVLITKKETLLKKLAEKRTALISQAVTKGCDRTAPMKDSGIEWLGEIPAHWNVLQIKRAFVLQRGVDITKEEQSEGEVPVVSSGGIFSYHDTAYAKAPGVIVGRKGTLGKVYYLEQDYWPHDTTLYVIHFYTNYPRFIYYKLLSMQLETWDTGSANPTLNRNLIHPVKTPCPLVEEQVQIVDYLDSVTTSINHQTETINLAIAKLKEYRTALITNAVTGKIDVRDVILELEPVEAA